MKQVSIALVILLALSLPRLWATKYTAAFLNAGAGARALGMGGSFGALGLDATTIHWNPAALGRLPQAELVLMHSAQFSDFLQYDTGHFVLPNTVSGSFGLGFIRLATGDIYFTRNLGFRDWGRDNLPGTGDQGENNGVRDPGEQIIYDPSRLKVVNDSEIALFLSYARTIRPNLAIGGNIKLLRQSVGSYSSFGWGFDVGALYEVNAHLTFGLNLQDLFGTVVRWNTGHSDVRTINVRPAMAYRHIFPSLKSRINLAGDVDIRFDKIKANTDLSLGPVSFDFHAGGEYWFYDLIALRLGSEQKSFTAGAGLKVLFVEIDYAFAGYDLGNTHRISLTLHRPTGFKLFGKEKKPVTEELPPPQIIKPEEEKQPEIPQEKLKEEQPEPVLVSQQVGTIEFETGKAIIRPSCYSALSRIAHVLKEHPTQIIKVIGHTDNVPIHTPEYPSNQVLSEARAEAVKKYLVQIEGIEADRIITVGYGTTRPIASNETEQGRQQNRRVEIVITEWGYENR